MDSIENARELPIPDFFDPQQAGEVWRVPYQQRAADARLWAEQYHISPSARDKFKIAFIGIDIQNTFCIPGYELYVGGRSGMGAVEDNQRLVAFLYRNLANLTHIVATLDTHNAMQIFHPIFLIDEEGKHPAPLTLISYEDVLIGRWRFNPAVADSLGITPDYGQQHLLHYAEELKARHKYDLTIWPYHVMVGSLGHALVSQFSEFIFFHTIARQHQDNYTIKGNNPLTEHYSAIGPEVLDGPFGEKIASKSATFLHLLRDFNIVIIAGQAKSHCVAWTIADLLEDINIHEPGLTQKVYLLEDCTSPVVAPGIVDYTDAADAAFARFAEAGMHLVRSTDPIVDWPGIEQSLNYPVRS
ncbi:MAG: isochorismatase [Chloroflexi bacterium]|nr:isochorismatase [Chloroflexota bacterium]